MEKVNIKGIELFPFTSRQQLAQYADAHPGILVAVNAEKILNQTEQTRRIINGNIGYCDGSGPLMALRSMGHKEAIKVAGCELWLSLVEQFHEVKTFYLVGGKQEIIEQTVAQLRAQFPDIRIAGYRNGYLSSPEEEETLIADIVEKRPDVVFVAMGSPKQEMLMGKMLSRHKAIYQGLGGSFDVYTGHVKRAPKWWVDHHVEWLYRLIHQPQRIKRQMKLWKFAWWILVRKF